MHEMSFKDISCIKFIRLHSTGAACTLQAAVFGGTAQPTWAMLNANWIEDPVHLQAVTAVRGKL
jgi:hypothetical protein